MRAYLTETHTCRDITQRGRPCTDTAAIEQYSGDLAEICLVNGILKRMRQELSHESTKRFRQVACGLNMRGGSLLCQLTEVRE